MATVRFGFTVRFHSGSVRFHGTTEPNPKHVRFDNSWKNPWISRAFFFDGIFFESKIIQKTYHQTYRLESSPDCCLGEFFSVRLGRSWKNLIKKKEVSGSIPVFWHVEGLALGFLGQRPPNLGLFKKNYLSVLSVKEQSRTVCRIQYVHFF